MSIFKPHEFRTEKKNNRRIRAVGENKRGDGKARK